jgi:ABC-type methionine transport system ATPase subunit
MHSQTLRLIYPPTLLHVPIINQLIRKFDVTVNILRAQIDANAGWIDLQLEGDGAILKQAIAWLESTGLAVEQITN